MSSQSFNSNIYVSSELTVKLVNVAQDLALRAVRECGDRYNFDAEEAIVMLGLSSVEVVHSSKGRSSSSVSKKERSEVVKASFPLPFNGECNDSKCCGLRQNNGLYTQCQVARKGEKRYCKTCEAQADKNGNGKPDYGTIEDRLAVDIFDYVDPRGIRPVGYKKIMKKLKITEEQVLEEAGKLNIIINMQHFLEVEEPRRGRKANPLKEAKVKAEGKKGRPKKTKKVLEIEGESEDLFASLVASASSMEEEEVVPLISTPVLPKKAVKSVKSEEEKAEKEAKLAAEKAEKEAKLAAEKAEKEAKLAAKKAEKEAKLAAEKEAKEAKLAAEKAEKEAKKEAEKAEKEAKAKEAAENKAKAAKKKEVKIEVEEEEQADVVKKIEFEGKKYLKSKKSGIVYDYKKYVEEEEQVVVGKWNEEKSKIDFVETEEEEEEDYEE